MAAPEAIEQSLETFTTLHLVEPVHSRWEPAHGPPAAIRSQAAWTPGFGVYVGKSGDALEASLQRVITVKGVVAQALPQVSELRLAAAHLPP